MENVNVCPFCGDSQRSVKGIQEHRDKYLDLVDPGLNDAPRSWYVCCNCEFIYRSPRCTQQEATLLYSKYRSHEFRKITPDEYFDRLTSLPDSESFSHRKAEFLRDALVDEKIDTILDVGCGGGILLHYLKRKYPHATMVGLEPNQDYCTMAKNRLGINVIQDYYRPDVVQGIFDLVLATDVLEHITDIETFWSTVVHNTKQEGYLFIEVPSAGNFRFLDIENDIFGAPHLYFFLPKHIEKLASLFGFTIDKFQEQSDGKYRKDYYLMKYVKGK